MMTELYERLQRRHVVKEKATYVCLVLFIMLLLAAALPAMLYWLAAYKKATPDKFLLPVSLIFAGISIPISIHARIRQHLTNFWQPVLQVYVVRILWMVPVYAICSLCELAFSLAAIHGAADMLKFASIPAALRDCYEAYTVLNFFYFMSTYLEVHFDAPPYKVLQNALRTEDIVASHTPRVTPSITYPVVSHPVLSPYVWAPWRLDTSDFFDQCRYVILLYATVAPLNGLVDVLGSLASSDDASALAQELARLRAVQRGEPRHLVPRLLLLRDVQEVEHTRPGGALLEVHRGQGFSVWHVLPGSGDQRLLPRASSKRPRGAVGDQGHTNVRRDAALRAAARLGLPRGAIRTGGGGLARGLGRLLRGAAAGAAALAPPARWAGAAGRRRRPRAVRRVRRPAHKHARRARGLARQPRARADRVAAGAGRAAEAGGVARGGRGRGRGAAGRKSGAGSIGDGAVFEMARRKQAPTARRAREHAARRRDARRAARRRRPRVVPVDLGRRARELRAAVREPAARGARRGRASAASDAVALLAVVGVGHAWVATASSSRPAPQSAR